MTEPDYTPWVDRIDALAATAEHELIRLAEINSGSNNLPGLRALADVLAQQFAPLGGTLTRSELGCTRRINDSGEEEPWEHGPLLSIRKWPEAPLQVLLVGHMDTVFPVDHPFQSVRALPQGRLHGPGVADLKGGLMVMLNALSVLEGSPWAGRLGWEVLLNPDEEIGSPGSAPFLAAAAGRNHLGLVFEPSMPDGTLAGARKGSGNFVAVFRGRAAHAGREHHLGRNAIRAMADFTSGLDDLNGQRPGVTVNPGFVAGGGPVNVVPDRALLRFNVRIDQVEHEEWILGELKRLSSDITGRDGFELVFHGGFGRKPKPMTGDTQRLFELVADTGKRLGMDLAWAPTGGCCDGNNLAAAGLPNVDTLGVVGGNIHSDREYMELDSLISRGRLSALLLMRLASDQTAWPGLPGSSAEGRGNGR